MLLARNLFLLFYFSFSSSLFSFNKSESFHPLPYWSFLSGAKYYSLNFGKDSYALRNIGFQTGLSYTYPISDFELGFSFFLLVGPFDSLQEQDVSLDYFGGGGSFSFHYFLKIVPVLKNFSVGSSLTFSQITSDSSDEEAFKLNHKNKMGVKGSEGRYEMKLRTLSLGFFLSYHLFSSYQEILEKEKEASFVYGHSFSLALSFPLYGKMKKSFQRFTSKETFESMNLSERPKGIELSLVYGLSFL